jgi:hypothetical protein
MTAAKGLSMEKWFCWGSMGVAGLLLLLFILDAAINIPFGGINLAVDIIGVLCCAILVYLGWNAYSDLR